MFSGGDDGAECCQLASSGDARTDGGTDLSARDSTSTVSRRSPAKRVIAKSRLLLFTSGVSLEVQEVGLKVS